MSRFGDRRVLSRAVWQAGGLKAAITTYQISNSYESFVRRMSAVMWLDDQRTQVSQPKTLPFADRLDWTRAV